MPSIRTKANGGIFLLLWEIAANQPRMQTLEFFQTLAEARAASGRFYPFTAPAMTPSMIYFWQTRYITIIGRTVIMMQAIIGPISTRP